MELFVDSKSNALREQYLDDPLVKLEAPFEDDRGAIYPIVDESMESCVIIMSKTGTVRANHYHKTDWHYCHVMDGEIQYHWRATGDESEPRVVTIGKGECFFTPPMVDHAMVFTRDTTFLTLGRNPRDQKTYEEDIERIDLVRV
jgi:dTDP-4-dehydrorhamnose 3,5-epimerase-like enzyme